MDGKLEDFSPSELIQVIGLLGKSGVLRLRHGDEEGLTAFRGGKIIYAASPSVRESLGSLLLARGLISGEELTEGLARQAASTEKTRLGTILVEMGVLEKTTLEELIRGQFSTVISEFIHWNVGTFSFEVMELVDRGEVELEAADFLTLSGVESAYVLLDAARRADERDVQGELSDGQPGSLDVLLEQTTSPTIRGETVFRLLALASHTCGRCLLVAVHPNHFQVVGHVGLDKDRIALAKSLSTLEIPRAGPSILARAVEQRHSILARLPATEEDAKILESLGGPSPSKSVAMPLFIDGRVILVLYGDYLPEDLGTGRLEELEIAASNAMKQEDASQWVAED